MTTPPLRGHTANNVHGSGHSELQIGDRYYNSNSPSEPSRYHNKYYDVPRDPSPVFTGREEILKRLRKTCLPSEETSHQVPKRFVIWGLGGSGKTQISLKFAEENREKFWGIFWIDASTKANIERSFANIAQICGIAQETGHVKRWLSNRPDPWLLIFDNADNPSLDISRFFPAGARGSILITTRNPGCEFHATVGVCEIGKLEKSEATTLLLKTSKLYNEEDDATHNVAEQVASLLGYLALAIAHAGGVIREGRCTIDEYLLIYSQRRKELLEAEILQGKDSYEHTVYTTWEVSLSMIKELSTEAGRDAIELLDVFSFFHFEGIPEKIFTRAWNHLSKGKCPEWRPLYQPQVFLTAPCSTSDSQSGSASIKISDRGCRALGAVLSILSSYSLIRRDQNGFISLHPLVHTWAQDRLDHEEKERVWRMAIATLAYSSPAGAEPDDLRYRFRLVSHIDKCLILKIQDIFHHLGMDRSSLKVIFYIARLYQEAGHLSKAQKLAEQLLEASKDLVGEEDPQTILAMELLSDIYFRCYQDEKALELSEKAVQIAQRTLGYEHPDTLKYTIDLALIYKQLGRRVEALKLAKILVERSTNMLGKEDVITLSSMTVLGRIYVDSGLRKEGMEIQEQVVKGTIKNLGGEHPYVLSCMEYLVDSYLACGRLHEAVELSEEIAETRARIQGEDHPDTVRARNNLDRLKMFIEKDEQERALSRNQSKDLRAAPLEKSTRKAAPRSRWPWNIFS